MYPKDLSVMIRNSAFWIAPITCCLAISNVFAMPEAILGTPHDFSRIEQGNACISCHSDPADPGRQPAIQESSSCQSCHDGTAAKNVHISTRLLHDDAAHPVGVGYPFRKGYRPKWEAETKGARIIGQTIECASCHDPHDNSKHNFLRVENRGSALCFACHDL